MMQEMFGGAFGGPNAGAPPDISNLAKLLGQFGANDEAEEISDEKVKEAQKLFEECI
jgi:hypothetical protein